MLIIDFWHQPVLRCLIFILIEHEIFVVHMRVILHLVFLSLLEVYLAMDFPVSILFVRFSR